jgi:hypothetical protein
MLQRPQEVQELQHWPPSFTLTPPPVKAPTCSTFRIVERLREGCRRDQTNEFLLVVAPSGSPVERQVRSIRGPIS